MDAAFGFIYGNALMRPCTRIAAPPSTSCHQQQYRFGPHDTKPLAAPTTDLNRVGPVPVTAATLAQYEEPTGAYMRSHHFGSIG